MNRPKVTKQTLKALRGELLAKQNIKNIEAATNPQKITRTQVSGTANDNLEQKEQELEDMMDM